MTDTPDPEISVPEEETPSQRQARIRRQKREAKVTANASERLDKITRLSGRSPELVRKETPSATPPRSLTPSQIPSPGTPLPGTPNAEQLRAQEEYLRAFLRQPSPQGQGDGAFNAGQQEEDPMMKMLQSMMGGMGGMGGDFSNPNGAPDFASLGAGFNADDISKATGIPKFVTEKLLGGQKAPPTKAELQATRLWKVVHIIFATLAGLYLIFSINTSTTRFGENPPAPATFQNPFLIFATGELMVQSTRLATQGYSGKSGPSLWLQIVKELIGDGAIVVFILGVTLWWNGEA